MLGFGKIKGKLKKNLKKVKKNQKNPCIFSKILYD